MLPSQKEKRKFATVARRLTTTYLGSDSDADIIESRLATSSNPRFETLHAARDLRREQRRKALEASLDELTDPRPKSDIQIRRLPPSLSHSPESMFRRMALKEAVLKNADLWSETEMTIALLYLRGYSPKAIFTTLHLPPSSGYRQYNAVIESLRDALRD